jgi:peptidoglycan/xylan/chitin deacetylase (PgdA/CDA1 family)
MTTAASRPIPILMYHSVADESRGVLAPFTLSPDLFYDHMRHLHDEGYRTYSVSAYLEELDGGRPLPPKSVVLTFDDGYADFHEAALPVLAEHGLSATLYVTTGVLDGDTDWLPAHPADRRPALSQTQLEEVAAAGIECGAHTHTHPQLDVLEVDHAATEIRESKDILEQRLQRSVSTFAYPFGYYDRSVRHTVIEAGFRSACAVGDVVNTVESDRYALPRQTIKAGMTVDDLAGILARGASRTAWPRARAKEFVWRALRRAHAAHAARQGRRMGG